jgi:flagellar hook assembly protein FlgD
MILNSTVGKPMSPTSNEQAKKISDQHMGNQIKKDSSLDKLMSRSLSEQFELQMKLCLENMKNPDPTDPQNTSDMGESLIKILQGAQQAKSNQLMAENNRLVQNTSKLQSHMLVGSDIAHNAPQFNYSGDGTPQDIFFKLPPGVQSGNIYITNANGEVVKSLTPHSHKPGDYIVSWDGTNNNQVNMHEGNYKIVTDFKGIDDKTIEVEPWILGTVDEVGFTNDEAEYIVGKTPVVFDNIKRVFKHPTAPVNGNKLNILS